MILKLLENILKFTCLKWLKMILKLSTMVGENLEIYMSQMAKKWNFMLFYANRTILCSFYAQQEILCYFMILCRMGPLLVHYTDALQTC